MIMTADDLDQEEAANDKQKDHLKVARTRKKSMKRRYRRMMNIKVIMIV